MRSLHHGTNLTTVLAAAVLSVLALLTVPAVAQDRQGGERTGGVRVAVADDSPGLHISTGRCGGAPITVELTNTGRRAVYADATLSAPAPLALQRTLVSTYLPAGRTAHVDVPVTAPLGADPGTYPVTVASGMSTATADVTVTATAPAPDGDLARSASRITASTTHSGYSVCGAVDGDTDSAHWGTTGWNDGNATVWPDWFELQWDGPQTVGRVTLDTLDGTTYPAATYGLKDWDVQTLTDGEWKTVASVRGNTQGEVTTTFTPVRTTGLRLLLLAGNGADDYARIVELQAHAS